MPESKSGNSRLEKAGSGAGSKVTEAFELLSDGTRLAILLALWEMYDPREKDSSVAFSELYRRLGSRDSGNFAYHLDKLVGDFVEKSEEGYRLRNSGHKIVQAVIAGVGLDEGVLHPTEIGLSCYRCGAPVEISYRDQHLLHVCTECDGNTGPGCVEERPVGTLMMFDFEPAGLAGRDAGEVFVAGTIKSLREFGLLMRGVCPECSGAIEESVLICGEHNAEEGVCPECGTGDEVRARYVCQRCKYGDSYPVHAAVYDHPAVISFCYEHGIETTYGLNDPGACRKLWNHLIKDRTYSLESTDPIRIEVRVRADSELLNLTMDGDLDVLDVRREDRDNEGPPNHELHMSLLGDSGRDDVLPDIKDCLRYLREKRWPDGVNCPGCGGTETVKKGLTGKEAQRYRCGCCGSYFNDLTGTVFAGHRLSITEMFHVAIEMDRQDVASMSRELDRSYKSVLEFVHEVKEARERKDEPLLPGAGA